MECQEHKGNDVILVCEKCEFDLVCSKCLLGFHNGHQLISFEEAATSIRGTIQNQSSENAQLVLDLDSQLDSIPLAKKHQDEAYQQNIQKIQQRQKELHKIVDTAADNLLEDNFTEVKKNMTALNQQTETFTQQKTEASEFGLKLTEILNIKSSAELIKASRNMGHLSFKREACHFPPTVQYIEDSNNDDKIENKFGKVINLSLDSSRGSDLLEFSQTVTGNGESGTLQVNSKIERSFQSQKTWSAVDAFLNLKAHAVSVITSYDGETCAVKCKTETKMKLVSETGKMKQKVDLKSGVIYGLDMNRDGEAFVCSGKPNCIKRVTFPRAKVDVVFRTKLIPIDIRRTSSGDFFVTLFEQDSYIRNPNSERLLVKFSSKGKEQAIVERDSFNDILFHGPYKVKLNHAENTIAVINQESKDLRYLILLDLDLNVKLRFFGHGRVLRMHQRYVTSSDLQFKIYDAAFDCNDNIVICEFFSKSVQLLSATCDVLQQVFVDDVFSWSIGIAKNGKIWIGRDDGLIKVLS